MKQIVGQGGKNILDFTDFTHSGHCAPIIENEEPPLAESDLHQYIVYRSVVGSRAYGLDHLESDTDRRGIYLPPADLHWSLAGVPEQITSDEDIFWEVKKFLEMILKANPSALECLYTPIVEHASPIAQDLLDLRPRLLSKLVYDTFKGSAESIFRKMRSEIVNKQQTNWKSFMHLLRLLQAGTGLLRDGFLRVHVGEHRDRLLKISRGEESFESCTTWMEQLQQELGRAAESTQLPDRPDVPTANDWLLRARRSVI